MDYGKELKDIEAGGNYWKPLEGEYTVFFLGEAKEVSTNFGTEDQPNIKEGVEFQVEVDKKQYTWTVNKAFKKTSLYHQVIKFISMNGKSAFGQHMRLIVVGVDKDKRYTVPDAVGSKDVVVEDAV